MLVDYVEILEGLAEQEKSNKEIDSNVMDVNDHSFTLTYMQQELLVEILQSVVDTPFMEDDIFYLSHEHLISKYGMIPDCRLKYDKINELIDLFGNDWIARFNKNG